MNKQAEAFLVGASPAHATHEVRNQAAEAVGFNAFEDDEALRGRVAKAAPWATARCAEVGALAGDPAMQEAARLANEHVPVLRSHDRFGHRLDWVEFHPAWHELMRAGVEHELHALTWRAERPGAHVARAAAYVCAIDRKSVV